MISEPYSVDLRRGDRRRSATTSTASSYDSSRQSATMVIASFGRAQMRSSSSSAAVDDVAAGTTSHHAGGVATDVTAYERDLMLAASQLESMELSQEVRLCIERLLVPASDELAAARIATAAAVEAASAQSELASKLKQHRDRRRRRLRQESTQNVSARSGGGGGNGFGGGSFSPSMTMMLRSAQTPRSWQDFSPPTADARAPQQHGIVSSTVDAGGSPAQRRAHHAARTRNLEYSKSASTPLDFTPMSPQQRTPLVNTTSVMRSGATEAVGNASRQRFEQRQVGVTPPPRWTPTDLPVSSEAQPLHAQTGTEALDRVTGLIRAHITGPLSTPLSAAIEPFSAERAPPVRSTPKVVKYITPPKTRPSSAAASRSGGVPGERRMSPPRHESERALRPLDVGGRTQAPRRIPLISPIEEDALHGHGPSPAALAVHRLRRPTSPAPPRL